MKDRVKGITESNLEKDEKPMERALGVGWCIESDAFKFRIVMQDRPFMRRGILSTCNSVYKTLQCSKLRPFWLPWRVEKIFGD